MSRSQEGSTSPTSFRKGSTSTPKVATIEESGADSPSLAPLDETRTSNLHVHSTKQHRHHRGRGHTGRSSRASSPGVSPDLRPQGPDGAGDASLGPGPTYQDLHGNLVRQLLEWVQDEKRKRADSTSKGSTSLSSSVKSWVKELQASPAPIATDSANDGHGRSNLEKLEKIVNDSAALAARLSQRTVPSHRPFLRQKSSTTKRLRRPSLVAASSDTEYFDGDAYIPSVEAVLDNTKTLGYVGGTASDNTELSRTTSSRSMKMKEDNWIMFKNDIIKLAHTLRLKGWRQVPLDGGAEVDVQRLSGALTNAVYVVTPPRKIVEGPKLVDSGASSIAKRRPRQLLLRIYGPQVEHLIDREAELEILRRLARKNIGPRLLGTFLNGRFEEFLNAETLTPEDIRKPEIYKQIAKRMRELHDGIDLLDSERTRGPFVWQNWDKWVARCADVITWLDRQVLSHRGPVKARQDMWKTRGLVCGVEWAQFRKAVETYRKWLTKQYGGEDKVKAGLVFAHNDTQYGNLLRLVPTGESPLLLPANEHKQLVVIDFEYANANPLGIEFANHFTEWCYNYHSPKHPYACNTAVYPTPKDQQRFLSAYVQHSGASARQPEKLSHEKSISSISSFMLDNRGPPSQYDAEEAAREEQVQGEVEHLMKETRLWRVANSAQWVAWGIVQAKVPGLVEALGSAIEDVPQPLDADSRIDAQSNKDQRCADTHEDEPEAISARHLGEQADQARLATDTPIVPHEHETDDDPEFDYLAYAQQRALFFWGDLLELGLVKAEDLPEDVVQRAKRIPY